MPKVRVQGTNDVINFPDGLSQEQIKQALSQRYSTPATQAISDRLSVQHINRPPVVEPVETSLSQNIGNRIGEALTDYGITSNRMNARDSGQTLGLIAESVTPAGTLVGIDDMIESAKQGDPLGVGLGLLSALPVVGGFVRKARKSSDSLIDAVSDYEMPSNNMFDEIELTNQKISDNDFKDLTLFHGTTDDFSTPKSSDRGNYSQGFYLTNSPEKASSYAKIKDITTGRKGGQNVIPYKASFDNPYIANPDVDFNINTDEIKNAGYDGIIVKNSFGDGKHEVVSLYPERLTGLFDGVPSIDDIPEDPLYKFSNVNPEYVETIGELGGLPSPSIGIAKAGAPVDSFGEISLIGRVGSFEGDPTFAADVYSPRQPRAEIEVPYDNIVAEQARLKADSLDIYQNYGAPRLDTSSDPFDAARTEPAYIAEFARSKGIDVSPEAQAKESKDLLNLQSYFGTELDDDTGITDSLSQQAKKYFASWLPPKPPEGASEIRKKKYQNKLQLNQQFFTDGKLNDFGYDILKSTYQAEKAKSIFDARTASRNLNDQFREQGLNSEYEEFITDKVKSLNPEKSLFDSDYFYNTGKRRSLDYNLKNITKMMTKGDIRGGEGFAGASGGGARALVTPELKSLKDIKDARGRIITSDEFSGLTSEMSDMTVRLQSELIKDIPEIEDLAYDYNGFYNELKGYIDGSGSILNGLGEKNKKLLDLYIKSLEEMPTEYFEIKPQRAVELSEFYGAAVPKGTSRKVTAPLENAGIKIEYYDPDKGRQSAIKSLHKQSNGDILFSAGGIALVTAATVSDEDKDDEI